MKNYVQKGDTLTLPAPYAVASGGGLKIGSIFGVASGPAAAGASVDLCTRGVFSLAKAAGDSFAVGDKAYWSDATKTLTATATGNTLVGVAVVAAVSGAGAVSVRLNGAFS